MTEARSIFVVKTNYNLNIRRDSTDPSYTPYLYFPAFPMA